MFPKSIFFHWMRVCVPIRARASAKRLPPFFGKTFYWKELLCAVCVCKKWHCRFFEKFASPQYESVRVWAFLVCKKIEIRVMWTFTASKKENPCSFLRVRSSAEKLHSFSEVFLSCGNIKDLLKAPPISKKRWKASWSKNIIQEWSHI